MRTVRTFVAVDIGDEIRNTLYELQRKLKKVHSNVRWIRPKGMHLTLVFLGNVPGEELNRLASVIDRTCRGVKAFELKVQSTGTFGKPGHPRVIWAGTSDCPPLMALQKRIGNALLDADIVFDRKTFSPHLTLGRLKSVDPHTPALLDKLEKYKDTAFGSVLVSEVKLMKSELTPRGAEYGVLHRVTLI